MSIWCRIVGHEWHAISMMKWRCHHCKIERSGKLFEKACGSDPPPRRCK